MQHDDKQRIQRDIEHAGNRQKDKRHASVAQRAHKAGAHVIQNGHPDAAADNGRIAHRLSEDALRRIEQAHQRLDADHHAEGQQRPQPHAEHQHHGCRPAQLIHLLRAVKLTDDDAASVAHSVGKIDHQIIERRGRANRRNRRVADKVTRNHRVSQRINLLHHLPDEQRQRKPQNELHRAAPRHVYGSLTFSPRHRIPSLLRSAARFP